MKQMLTMCFFILSTVTLAQSSGDSDPSPLFEDTRVTIYFDASGSFVNNHRDELRSLERGFRSLLEAVMLLLCEPQQKKKAMCTL